MLRKVKRRKIKQLKKLIKSNLQKKGNKLNTVTDEKSKPDTVKETEIKEKVKSAKDWGRASNDPRNKS